MAVYYNNQERFLSKVDKDGPSVYDLTPCWIWTKLLDKDGYGRFYIDGKNIPAHRYAFREWCGPLIDGLMVLHACDTPACVNPEHLTQDTALANNQDMYKKGRNTRFFKEKNPINKLTEYQVLKIRAFYETGFSMTELAKIFNVTRKQIYNIITRKNWKDLEAVERKPESRTTDTEVLPNELD